MSITLSLSNKDKTTSLVYNYLLPIQLEVKDAADENPVLTLADNKNIVGSNSVIIYLIENFGELKHKNANDIIEVQKWLNETDPQINPNLKNVAKDLNDHLALRTYIIGNYLTVADLVVFSRLHSIIAEFSSESRFEFSNLIRWFDFIQHTAVSKIAPKLGFNVIEFNLEAPKVDKSKQQTQDIKKEQVEKAPEKESSKVNKKNDKKADKTSKKATKETKESTLVITPSLLDLRVGHIIKAEKHPAADALYVEQIDVGEETPRTVVSGLVMHIPLDQMQNRDVILLCNLKPAAMRGIKSHAMVLAATSHEGKVELVDPPIGSKPGDRAFFDGFEGVPEPILNPKKKIWETLQPGLLTTANKEASWVNSEDKSVHLLKTEKGLCTVPTVVSGTIK
ncbi:19826_t:CDS:2 [Entrophospora sp. SA101]|nr:965_t:CDS:2 [Entrophospora sp. SA101]CAJ0628212.1 10961_t:CDS:2 [Entrophospora sp. SA101]CAJ0745714.1 22766_t:CDS:2 [Entrophospora sp. SA101]CAJ0759796.1 19826_t:CDS:2 [Entrophospora sp. SA101]CAJ0849105.1 11983_t:CDS:2 [Entrophospora sp. SA101]